MRASCAEKWMARSFWAGGRVLARAETAVRFGNEYFAAGGKLGLRKAF